MSVDVKTIESYTSTSKDKRIAAIAFNSNCRDVEDREW